MTLHLKYSYVMQYSQFYICGAHDYDAIFTFETALEPSRDPPVLYPLMTPSNPSVGDDADIVCKLRRGADPVTFEWLYNGRSIPSHRQKARITTSPRTSLFSIRNIQVDDIGNYTCVASNAHGRDSQTESFLIEGV